MTAKARAGRLLAGVAGLLAAGFAAWAAVERPHALPASASSPRSLAQPSALARAIAEDAPLPTLFAAAGDLAPPPPGRTRMIDGPMETVLYGTGRARLDGRVIAEALDLFAHKLDLTRDVALGDRIRLLVRRTPMGEALDYAEWRGSSGAARFYRRAQTDGFSVDDFADEDGADVRRLLLRTPLAHPRVTSSFGFRLHPLLGYSRLHQGVDFGAPVGTPILAAADGVVRSTTWTSGYGRLVRLDHGGGLQTLYAHLSAVSPDALAGARVRQGQVIGWTGATGLVTGPHLHFEVRQDDQPIDPRLAKLPDAPFELAARLAFQARKRALDALLPPEISS